MIQAVIFDMDGILIDSEPFWQEAEIEIFRRIGVTLTREQCESMQGIKIGDVIKHWYTLFPWQEKTIDQIEREIIDMVIQLVKDKGVPKDGVYECLNFFEQRNIKIGLATSSSVDLIDTIMDKLGIRHKFQILHSSQFEKRGKPFPDVFLSTAAKLNTSPENCLVFEDSYNGLMAALNAGMNVIAIPESKNFNNHKFDIAHLKLKSLADFSEKEFLAFFKQITV